MITSLEVSEEADNFRGASRKRIYDQNLRYSVLITVETK